jgi:hypothetical protein
MTFPNAPLQAHTRAAEETVTYSDFEIAHTINVFLRVSKTFDLHVEQVADSHDAHKNDRDKLTDLHARLIFLAAKLSRMGVNFNDKGELYGIRVDDLGFFMNFEMPST